MSNENAIPKQPKLFRNEEEKKKFERLVKIGTSKPVFDLAGYLREKSIFINVQEI